MLVDVDGVGGDLFWLSGYIFAAASVVCVVLEVDVIEIVFIGVVLIVFSW